MRDVRRASPAAPQAFASPLPNARIPGRVRRADVSPAFERGNPSPVSAERYESARGSLGSMQDCPACGVGLTPEARFCPNCGIRLDEARGTRHVYGVLAPGPALVLAGVLLLAAFLALIVGSVLVAIVLLVLSALMFVLFVGALRRDDESPLARSVRSRVRRTRISVGLGRVSARAWASALHEVTALYFRAKTLRNERRRLLPTFGEATLRADTARADELRRRLEVIDEQLVACEQAHAAALAGARTRVSGERSPDQPTKESSVVDLGSGASSEQ